MAIETVDYMGIRLHKLTQGELISKLIESVAQNQKFTFSYYGFHTANITASSSIAAELFSSLDVLMPDGIAILYTTWLFGVSMTSENRGNGDIIAPYLFSEAILHDWKIYLLGGAPGVAAEAAEKLQVHFTNLQIVGTHHGHLNSEEIKRDVIKDINQSEATIVIVGMGQPIQEKWIVSNKDQVKAPVLFSVGGFFDHLCRRVDCYPPWVYKWKLNWAYRLFTEPRRLWKRYTFGVLYFGLRLFGALFVNLLTKFIKVLKRKNK